MMIPHYTLAEPVYYSGLDFLGRYLGFPWWTKGNDCGWQVVEAKEWEESCIGASTPNEIHSSKVVAKHRVEMNERLVGHDIEIWRTKEGAWTRKDE